MITIRRAPELLDEARPGPVARVLLNNVSIWAKKAPPGEAENPCCEREPHKAAAPDPATIADAYYALLDGRMFPQKYPSWVHSPGAGR